MKQQNRELMVAAAIGLQALGLGTWWEWFNGLLYGTNSVFWGIVKVLCLFLLLCLWSYLFPDKAKKIFGWNKEEYQFQDALAGLPLAALPLLIPFFPVLALMAKPFPMKMTAFLWLPWQNNSQIVKPEVYAMLIVAGVFILTAFLAKVLVVFIRLAKADEQIVNAKKLFVIGFLAYLLLLSWPACLSAPQSGEVSQLLTMQAMAFDARFSVEGVLSRADYFQFHPLQEIHFSGYLDKANNRLYLPVAPGMPLLFMTFYLLQGRWLAALMTILFAAGAAAQVYGFCRDQGFSGRASFWAWLVSLLNAPLLLYAYQQYEVASVAFLLIWGIRHAWKVGQGKQPGINASGAAAGFAAGLIWLAGLRFIFPSLVILGLLWYHARRTQQTNTLWTAGAAFVIPAFFALVFYLNIFTIFLDHSPYRFNLPGNLGFWINALAILADRYAGLIWNAPVWLLGLAGSLWLWGSGRRALASAILLPWLSAVFFALIFPDSRAEGSSFHRYLAPMMPLLGIGLAAFWDKAGWESRWGKIAIVLSGWGLLVGMVQTFFPFLTQEAARLKLAELVKALGWVYTWLPDLNFKLGMIDGLFGLGFMLGAAYLVYLARDFLNQPAARVMLPNYRAGKNHDDI